MVSGCQYRCPGCLCNKLCLSHCRNRQDLKIFRVLMMAFVCWCDASHRGTAGNYPCEVIIMAVRTFHLIGHIPFAALLKISKV